jgi:uncharacterized membrane protein YdjX (TVP38/TMEM64 family)
VSAPWGFRTSDAIVPRSVSPPPDSQSERRAPGLRILAVVALALTFYAVGRATGLTVLLRDGDLVREWVRSAGILGIVVFMAVFVAAQLTSVPAIVPLAFGVLLFGPVEGTVVGFIACLVGISVVFFMARTVGGRALGDLDRPWVKRLLVRLDERPIRTVATVRMLLWVFPPVNYALAMSRIRYRDYLVGSLIGLVLPMSAAGAVLGWLLEKAG